MNVRPFTILLPALLFLVWLPAFSQPAGEALSAQNVALVGHMDLEGGGMVDVRGTIAAVGHMAPPYATTLLDVTDPSRPAILSRIRARPGTHSHKARICGSTLVINVENYGGGNDVGLAVFDISDPKKPRERSFLPMGGGTGAHRFQFDCERKLVYTSGSADGFRGSIVLIIDLSDPARPREVGRWWMPGQRTGDDEGASGSRWGSRVHHPLRMGDRLYVSLWYSGFAILDITELARPRLVSHVNYHNGAGSPTHTALPVGHAIRGRRWLIVADEELGGGDPPAFLRLFDITDERRPREAATFTVERCASGKTGGLFGAHQPHEFVGTDNLIYAAWFSGGLRVIDIADPHHPREAGYYVPRASKNGGPPQSNDVFVTGGGLIFLIDRVSGLDILRFTGRGGR